MRIKCLEHLEDRMDRGLIFGGENKKVIRRHERPTTQRIALLPDLNESDKKSARPLAHCVLHEDRAAEMSCERCGDFICNECIQDLFKRQVCQDCHNKYGGKLLSDFQASLWGKRDGYVWLIGGFGSLIFLSQIFFWFIQAAQTQLSGTGTIKDLAGMIILIALFTAATGLTGSYLLLKKWARKALFLFPIVGVPLTVISVSSVPSVIVFSSLLVLLPFVFCVSAWTNPQNKLAFKIEISPEQLEKLFETMKSNQAAHNAFTLSVLALFIPPFLFLSLYLALRGRANCDAEGWPPVGGGKEARNGLILTTLGFIIWAGVFLSNWIL